MMDQVRAMDEKELMRNALVELNYLRSKLNEIRLERTEPIAIVGMSCRFPGKAQNVEAFWDLLRSQEETIGEVPPDRWSLDDHYDPNPETPGKIYTKYGSFLNEVASFDAPFFGISPKEALQMDPQQRLLLEVSWEALEHAGESFERPEFKQTGVFVGISNNDYAQLLVNPADAESIDTYYSTGNSLNVSAGRLSFMLGLHGPSMAIDTACSSSLVAIHTACQSIRNGECRQALAAGVNLLLSPVNSIAVSRARMLSADGRCKTFDAKADGYVRGEGCGAIVLKRLSHALADKNNILAVVRSSAVNQDGKSGGLTVPSGPAQQMLISQALKNGRLEAREIQYVETHGTGTSLGDPIEIKALSEVLCKDRTKDNPLYAGAVKTNIGHLEAASGIAGIIKTVLCLQKGEIPANLNFTEPNPHIAWENSGIVIPTSHLAWPKGYKRRIAGVSSFGFSGTNAHVILEEAPVTAASADPAGMYTANLFCISARSAGALDELITSYKDHLSANRDLALQDICYTANTGRRHFSHRTSIAASSTEDLINKLDLFNSGSPQHEILFRSGESLNTVFLCTGQGAQYEGACELLYGSHPVFKKAMDQCDELFRTHSGISILDILYPEEPGNQLIDQTAYTQPTLFSIEYSMSQLWQSWGVRPNIVLGHSIGELTAACIAGVFSLEDAVKLVAARGKLMQSINAAGAMLSVFTGKDKLKAILAEAGVSIDIAAINGPEQIVVSGDTADVARVKELMEKHGIRTRPLTVSHAFHSRLMEPILAEFEKVADSIRYSPPSVWFISNLTGGIESELITKPDYWKRNIRETVDFYGGMLALEKANGQVLIELGPSPVLLTMGRECLDGKDKLWVPSLRRGQSDWLMINTALGQLYENGYSIDWEGYHRPFRGSKLPLPTYPFQRQSYWPQKRRFMLATTAKPDQEVALYQVKWVEEKQEPKLQGVGQISNLPGSGKWLVFADPRGIGQAFCDQLRLKGESYVLIHAGQGFSKDDQGSYTIDPSSANDYKRFLEETLDNDPSGDLNIVHLWSLYNTSGKNSIQLPFPPVDNYGCISLLQLVKALAGVNALDKAKLALVTEASHAVINEDNPIRLYSRPVWAMAGVIAMENPEMKVRRIDVPGNYSLEDGSLLFEEIRSWNAEQIALRNGRRYKALLEHAAPLSKRDPFRFDKASSYLIAGGMGGLGLEIAGWMADNGVENLVLLSRSGIKNSGEEEALKALRKKIRHVSILTADLGDRQGLENVFEEIKKLPALKGVIHAAGVLEDGLVLHQSTQSFSKVMQAKTIGAWNLHELTKGLQLDFFVCFSSMASLFGSPGQSNYAAANAGLDALAEYRRALGLPSMTINWGPWEGAGMAGKLNSSHREALQKMGIKAMPAKTSIAVLEELLPNRYSNIGVFNIDWDKFSNGFTIAGKQVPEFFSAFIRRSLDSDLALASKTKDQLALRFNQASQEERHGLLNEWLQYAIAKITGLAPASVDTFTPLVQIGVDSLMAIRLKHEVKQNLGFELNLAGIMEGAGIDRLAKDWLSENRERNEGKAGLGALENNEAIVGKGTGANETGRKDEAGRTSPLSYGQRALWLIYKMSPESAAYNTAFAAKINPALDIQKLKIAFSRLIARHSMLTCTIHEGENGIPYQQLNPEQELHSFELSVSGNEDAILEKVKEIIQQPFDLEKGPLYKLVFLQPEGTDPHPETIKPIMIFSVHHIVYDEWSSTIFLKELMQLYNNDATHNNFGSGRVPFHYFDYVARENQWVQSEAGGKLLAYWLNRLDSAPIPLYLATDYPRPALQTFEGRSIPFMMREELGRDLKTAARNSGVTLYTWLLSVFQLLLSKYSGQKDILVGTATAGRDLLEDNQVVGYFVNPLVLRGDLQGDPPFSAFLQRNAHAVTEAIDHHRYPFPLLMENLQKQQGYAAQSLYQVVFSFLTRDDLLASEQEKYGIELLETSIQEGAFDITLECIETHGLIKGQVKYRSDLFKPATIQRLIEHYLNLLAGSISGKELPVSRILLTSDPEVKALLEINNTRTQYPADKTIQELFEAEVRMAPDAIAVVAGEVTLTYHQLNEKANKLAHYLKANYSIQADDRIGLVSSRCEWMIIAILGILKAGGAYIPLDPAYPEERLRFMMENASVKALLIENEDLYKHSGTFSNVCVLEKQWPLIEKCACDNPVPVNTSSDLAYLMYTSGSTGKPKGVMIEHKSVVRLVRNSNYSDIKPSDRILQLSNYAFDGSVYDIFGALLNGAGVYMISKDILLSKSELLAFLQRHSINITFITTAYFNNLVDLCPEVLGQFDKIYFGGERASVPHIRKAISWMRSPGSLVHVYGPTEGTTFSSFYPIHSLDENSHSVPIGKPIANTSIFILDDSMQLSPFGVPGEIYIGGEGLARGYLKNEELNREKFVPSPFSPYTRLYRTGDYARWTDDGNIEFIGRKDDQVKIRGHRIELGEIESMLSRHPLVKEQVVLVVDQSDGRKDLVAFIVAAEPGAADAAMLSNFLRQELAEYMVPGAFVFLEKFPANSNGKIDRKALLGMAPENVRNLELIPARTPEEIQLAAIWKEILHIQEIGITDNFFQAGGNSLLAMQVLSRIRSVMGYDVAIPDLFREPTITGILQLAHSQKNDEKVPEIKRVTRKKYVLPN